MATLQIQERIVIKAPVEAVWALLLDPERVVTCLPGATYDGAESDKVFLGHMKVKVGPITTMFAGKATMAEVVEAEHRVTIVGEGKDQNGNGSARLEMKGRVSAVDGGAELAVDADVDIAGKLVTFGRGLIKSVSAQMFKQFAARAQELLEQPPAAATETKAETKAETAAAATAEPTAIAEAAAPAEATPATTTTTATTSATSAPVAKPGGLPAARAEAEPLNALPILLRAIGDGLVGALRALARVLTFGYWPKRRAR